MVKCLTQEHNMLVTAGFEPATFGFLYPLRHTCLFVITPPLKRDITKNVSNRANLCQTRNGEKLLQIIIKYFFLMNAFSDESCHLRRILEQLQGQLMMNNRADNRGMLGRPTVWKEESLDSGMMCNG